MKTFLGFFILIDILRKSSIKIYWSIEELISILVFSRIMTRDQFRLIQKFLKFQRQQGSRLRSFRWKSKSTTQGRPFLDLSREVFQKTYHPGSNLSVYESLILYKRRFKLKQYIKTKRSRFGMKLHELWDNARCAQEKGCNVQIQIQTGICQLLKEFEVS